MGFDELKCEYDSLRGDLQAGRLSPEAFQQEVGRLRLQDASGTWWQVCPEDGSWLRWSGQAWVAAVPPGIASVPPDSGAVSPVPPPPAPRPPRAAAPETLADLLILFWRGLVRGLPRKLMTLVVVFLLVWVVHTYVLVRWNNGYWKVTNEFYGSVLSLKGRVAGGTVFWLLLGGLCTSVIVRVRAVGFRGFGASVAGMPASLGRSFSRAGRRATPLLLAGAAAGALVCAPWHNRPISVLLAALLGLALSRGTSSWVFLVARLAWSDARRLAGRDRAPGAGLDGVFVFVAGAAAGCLLAAVLPYLPASGYVASVLLALGALILLAPRGPAAATGLWLLGVGALVLLGAARAFAHDGGVLEAGGWGRWLQSQGALRAILQGLPAAIAAALGSLLAQLGLGSQLGGPLSGLSAGGLLGGPGEHRGTVFHRCPGGPGTCSRYGLPQFMVNTASLNLVVEDTLFAYQGLGPPVELTLTYNAAPWLVGMFGRGWRFTHESSIEENAEGAVLTKGSGRQLRFLAPASGSLSPSEPVEYEALDRTSDRLLRHEDHWLAVTGEGKTTLRFSRGGRGRPGRLVAVGDLHGNRLGLDYTSAGCLASVTDASGRTTRFGYDDTGKCISLTEPGGRSATFAYSGSGDLIRTTDLLGTAVEYEYDPDGFLTRMSVGPDGKTTEFTYEAGEWGKHVSAVEDACGGKTVYESVSTEPREARVTDPEGGVTVYGSSEGLTERVVDPLGNAVLTAYAGGLPVRREQCNGAVTSWEYDGRGNLLRESGPHGVVAEFVHDDWGNVVRRTNAVGERETYEYDGRRNLTAIVAADGGRSTFSYDQRGLLVGLADQAGAVTTLGYDRFGNVTSVTDPLGNGTTVAYDPSGIEVTSITDCRGNVTRYAHDANRRLTEVVHPDGTRNARIHDCCAEVLYTDENGGRLGVDRDALLRVIRGVQSPGQVVDLVYDGNSRLTQVTDALGRSTALVYDKAGRVTRTIDPTGQSVGVSYDGQGHPVSLVDERGGRTDLAYDQGGRLTRVTYPTGRSVETDRDALGRVVAVRNGRGEQVRLAYGPSGFLSGKWHGSDQVALYEHDAVGNLTSVQDVTGTTSYEYDARRRPTAIRFPGGLEASCSYDEAGNPMRAVYPGSLVISYEYDARNRVSAVRWGEEQGVRLDYDGVGNVVRSICSNGTQSVFVYDRANRLVQLQHASGGRAFASRAYVRDAVGNLSRESSPESPPRHLPPPASATATYDAANQLVTLDGERCEHDADGNLAVVGADRWRALYDPENRLVRVTRAGSFTAYAYNGVGQRVRREEGDGVARYHYGLRGRLLFVTDESGTLEWAYVYAGDELVAAVDGSGKSFFYHFDIRGSTLALTDSQGSVVARYDYGPWGDPLHRDGDLPNLFTYVGKHGVLDDGSGLYFMKHRCYEAILGRYLQRDPLGVADSFNLYAYVLNNPINGIDPLGLSTTWGNVAWFLNVWQASVWLVVTVPTLPLPIISITTFVRGVSGMYCTLGPRASEYEREDYGGTDLVLDLIDPTNLRSKIPEAIDQGIEWAKTKRRELGQEFDETFNLENVKAKYGQR